MYGIYNKLLLGFFTSALFLLIVNQEPDSNVYGYAECYTKDQYSRGFQSNACPAHYTRRYNQWNNIWYKRTKKYPERAEQIQHTKSNKTESPEYTVF